MFLLVVLLKCRLCNHQVDPTRSRSLLSSTIYDKERPVQSPSSKLDGSRYLARRELFDSPALCSPFPLRRSISYDKALRLPATSQVGRPQPHPLSGEYCYCSGSGSEAIALWTTIGSGSHPDACGAHLPPESVVDHLDTAGSLVKSWAALTLQFVNHTRFYSTQTLSDV